VSAVQAAGAQRANDGKSCVIFVEKAGHPSTGRVELGDLIQLSAEGKVGAGEVHPVSLRCGERRAPGLRQSNPAGDSRTRSKVVDLQHQKTAAGRISRKR